MKGRKQKGISNANVYNRDVFKWFDEWKSIYDGDHDLRKQFMKDDVVGKVSENCAMIKFTVLIQRK